jgi:hypothetical protein
MDIYGGTGLYFYNFPPNGWPTLNKKIEKGWTTWNKMMESTGKWQQISDNDGFLLQYDVFFENDGTTIEMMAVQHTKHVKKDKVDIV